ncbi:MAG: hypothetical protein ACP5O1_07465 [Phycisphaerae bacterium]
MRTLRTSTATAACRLVPGLIFIAAALLNWFDPAGQSTYYGTLAHAAPAVGWAIIVGELLLGAWLISGIRAGLVVVGPDNFGYFPCFGLCPISRGY